jgi:AcrR family transcriptional regulator
VPPAADAAVAPPPRSARGQRTRAALVAAARSVFEREGYLDARTTDIAREAGVAAGSFYTYFPDKQAAFAAVLESLQDELLAPGAAAPGPREQHPLAAIRAGNRAYLEAYRRNAGLMAAMEQAALVDDRLRAARLERARTFAERHARAIARWQAAGLVDPDLDPRGAAVALDAMVSRLAEHVFVHGAERTSLDDLTELVTRMWAGALGLTPSPRKEP